MATRIEGHEDERHERVNSADASPPPPAPAAETAPRLGGAPPAGVGTWPAIGEPIGGPLKVAWREGTLTRAKELEALATWFVRRDPVSKSGDSVSALYESSLQHLRAARDAATATRRLRDGALLERAMSRPRCRRDRSAAAGAGRLRRRAAAQHPEPRRASPRRSRPTPSHD